MKNEAPLSIKKWFIQNLFSFAAISVAFANLWLLNKLSPVFQDIAVHAQRIANLEDKEMFDEREKKLKNRQVPFSHL